jgi:thymidylate synthase
MQNYHELLKKITDQGNPSDDRTNTGTKSLFGEQLRYDLREGFPLLTTKFVPFNLVRAELLWFLSGSTNNEELRKLNGSDKPTIWEEWCLPNGNLGPIYGGQFRSWHTGCGRVVDQIERLIANLKTNPHSRRHVVSAWNVGDLPDETKSPQQNVYEGYMALAPCHCLFQFYTRKLGLNERAMISDDRGVDPLDATGAEFDDPHAFYDEQNVPRYGLSCQLFQRSADAMIGIPFNIASYALLTHMVAQVVNMVPEEFILTFGDVHAYRNHVTQIEELLQRDPDKYPLPTLRLNPTVQDIDDFTAEDIVLEGYQSYPAIKAPVAV